METILFIGTVGVLSLGIYNMLLPSRNQGKVEAATRDLSNIVGNLHKRYKSRAVPKIECPPGISFSSASAIYPEGMVESEAVVNNIFNQGSKVSTATATVCNGGTGDAPFFIVRFSKLNKTMCSSLVSYSSNTTQNLRLYDIKINSASVPFNFNGTVTPFDAFEACREKNVTIEWYFRLSQL